MFLVPLLLLDLLLLTTLFLLRSCLYHQQKQRNAKSNAKKPAAKAKTQTMMTNPLVAAGVVLDKETTVVDLHAPEEALVAEAKGALAVDLQHGRSGQKRKTIMMANPSGPVTRSSRLASSLAILAEEEGVLQPVAEEVAVSNRRRIVKLSFNNQHTRWINQSNSRWIEIKAEIKHQLDNDGFNYGKTTDVCGFIRKALNDGTLTPEIVRELNAMNFEWSSYGAY